MPEINKYLSHCTALQALTASEIAVLAASCQFRRLAGGTRVYHDSEEPHHVYLIVRGRVRTCHIGESGKQSILQLVQPGQLFGELAVCVPGTREERAETIESSEIISIPAHNLRQLIQSNSGFAFDLLSLFGVRRRLMKRRLKSVLFQSTRHRLVSLLQELAECDGAIPAEETHIRQSLSHQDLASMIGVTRESVTLMLGQLRTEGLIRIERRQIVICQPGCLK